MLDHRLQDVGSLVNSIRRECKQLMTVFLLWVLLSSCFMFDLKSFCCNDMVAVAKLQIQLELNVCSLCSNQTHRSLESLENFLKALFFLITLFAFCFLTEDIPSL